MFHEVELLISYLTLGSFVLCSSIGAHASLKAIVLRNCSVSRGVIYLIAACNLVTLLQQIIKPMSDSGQTWCSEQRMPPGQLSWGSLSKLKGWSQFGKM